MRTTKHQLDELIAILDHDISSAFTEKEIRQLAADSGFYLRAGGKITGQVFLELVVFHASELKKQSLEEIALVAETEYGIKVSKQAIQERFNNYAVTFLTRALEQLFRKHIPCPPILKESTGFKRILVKDSTCFGIDKSMKALFPVSDSEESTSAAVRIQFEYDVLSGVINDLSINPFRDQDNKDWRVSNYLIEEGDLIIRDLAYMHLSAINDMVAKRKAFVLSRLDPRVDVYQRNDRDELVKVDFRKEHEKMRECKLSFIELCVLVGKKAAVPMRMVIYNLPDDVAAEKVRKVRKERKRNGSKSIKAETLIRARLTIMITNISSEVLQTDSLYELYGVRWQIELMFKVWKSIAGIDKVKKVKAERLLCYIHARLLLIVMVWQFYWSLNRWWYARCMARLSPYKAAKRIMNKLTVLRDVYLGATLLRNYSIKELIILVTKFGTVDTKKGSKEYLDILRVTLIDTHSKIGVINENSVP
jgi:hypothetical protein